MKSPPDLSKDLVADMDFQPPRSSPHGQSDPVTFHRNRRPDLAQVGRGFLRLLTLSSFLLALAACAPRLQTIGPDIDQPRLGDKVIHTADGVDLPLREWLPKDDYGKVKPIKAVVIALHGF